MDSSFESFPSALMPIYRNEQSNQPIQLYQGELEITQQKTVIKGNGSVFFEWLPSPKVKFDFLPYTESPLELELEQANLKLSDSTLTKVSICSEDISEDILSSRFSGIPKKGIILGDGQDLSYVIFHLTNFHPFLGSCISAKSLGVKHIYTGRLQMEAYGWTVTIDSLPNIDDIIKTIKSQRGYAITHVGKLERADKSAFPSDDANKFLEGLSYFLSFSRGFWIAPLLQVGHNIKDEKVWEKWKSYKLSPWRKDIESWFSDDANGENISRAFPGFWHCWNNDTWKEPIRLAIHWYMESNAQAGAIQGSIVLQQAAFELLSWVLLVEDRKIISPGSFNERKVSAAEKLRKLFSEIGIPSKIPENFQELGEFSKEEGLNWEDGPHALTEIRNSIVHAGHPKKRNKISKLPSLGKSQAWKLGLWYLELVLLYLFDYEGDYFSRVTEKEESVPWTKNRLQA